MAAVLVTADLGGEPSVVLLGDPGWYAHFGFQTAADHGIGSPGPWADRFFQVRPLQAWRPELAGAFRYPPASTWTTPDLAGGSDLERPPPHR